MPDAPSKHKNGDFKKNPKPALELIDGEIQRDVSRAMPSAREAELSVLSTMASNPEIYVSAAQEKRLTGNHFYVPAHRKLFTAIVNTFEKGQPVEIVSFIQRLEDAGELDAVGGHAGVTEMFYFATTAAHFDHHLELVKDKFTLRSMIETCTEAITQAFDDPASVTTLIDTVESEVLKIREVADTEEGETVEDALEQVIISLDKIIRNEKDALGISTGYPVLDKMAGGLRPGEMFIIAARPAMGKTSFVMNIVEEVVLNQKRAAMVFSLEMTTQQLVQRMLISRARYNFTKLIPGTSPIQRDLTNIQKAAGEIRTAPLFIDDTPSISISELRAKARRKHREHGLAMIAIDYLQLMRSTSKQADASREREVAEISAGLKGLAKELNIPILVLAQLNRGPEARTGGKPRMSDLRESGSIEQDADLIGLLFRDKYYASDEAKDADEEIESRSELIIGKNRHGSAGRVPLHFVGELMRFETREETEEERQANEG